LMDYLSNPMINISQAFKNAGMPQSSFYRIRDQGFIHPDHLTKLQNVLKVVGYVPPKQL
jgi:hypothetical protein